MRTAPRQYRLLARTVLLEALRRQDGWILLLLMLLFGAVAAGVRTQGTDSPEAAVFALNFGLTLSGLFAHFFTLLLAVRQFSREFDTRGLYPLLARPVSRARLLSAKWGACVLCGLAAFLPLCLIALAAAPPTAPLPGGAWTQHLALLPLSLAWTAALGFLLRLWMPGGPALFAGLLLVFGSNAAAQWGGGSFAAHLLPRVGALNLVNRHTAGLGALPAGEFGRLALYAGGWILLCLGTALARFRRRPL